MTATKAKPTDTKPAPRKQEPGPVFVLFRSQPGGPWCSAVVRSWNADETVSLVVFPHGVRTFSWADSVPHVQSELARKEDRPHTGVWDWPRHDKQLRAEVADLRKRLDELTNLVTK